MSTESGKPDYYTGVGPKVIDFLLGFLVMPIIPVIIGFVINPPEGIAAGVLLFIAGIVAAFVLKRRFLAIGMLCALAVPLLFFGACLLVLMNVKF